MAERRGVDFERSWLVGRAVVGACGCGGGGGGGGGLGEVCEEERMRGEFG